MDKDVRCKELCTYAVFLSSRNARLMFQNDPHLYLHPLPEAQAGGGCGSRTSTERTLKVPGRPAINKFFGTTMGEP